MSVMKSIARILALLACCCLTVVMLPLAALLDRLDALLWRLEL